MARYDQDPGDGTSSSDLREMNERPSRPWLQELKFECSPLANMPMCQCCLEVGSCQCKLKRGKFSPSHLSTIAKGKR